MSGKLSEIYNISGETSYDSSDNWKSKFEYDENTLYSPSVNVSYFFDKYNIVKIDIDILKNIMKENLKEGISNHGVIGSHFTNDFRISYFDNKILCIEEYADYFGGREHGEI